MASRWAAALGSVPINRQHNRSSTRKLCPIQQLLTSAIGLNQYLPNCMDPFATILTLFSSASSVLRLLPGTIPSSSPDPVPSSRHHA